MKPKKGIFRKVLWRLGLARRSDLVAVVEQLKAQQDVGRHLSRSLQNLRNEIDEVFVPFVERSMQMTVSRRPEEDLKLEMAVDKRFIKRAFAASNQVNAVGDLCHSAARRMMSLVMKELTGTITQKAKD